MISFAFISNYGNRLSKSKFLEILTTFSISGYAIPGIILAVAFITFISWFDNNIVAYFKLETIKSIFITDCLKSLGAKNVVNRAEFDKDPRLIDKGLWDGVVDTVGGKILANAIVQTKRSTISWL